MTDRGESPTALAQDTATSVLRVVLFSGGRGSGALAEQLVRHPRVVLTIAINGYDDGASTGEVRRFLGDALGPSDFRKNASRVARTLGATAATVADLLDLRLPDDDNAAFAARLPALVRDAAGWDATSTHIAALAGRIATPVRTRIAGALQAFDDERQRSRFPFDFRDCSVGNLVFAGVYVEAGRRFNDAVDRYGELLGVRPGLIENVTDGTNAFLVAVDIGGQLLRTEADIVDARHHNRIREIYLVPRPLSDQECAALATMNLDGLRQALAERSLEVPINPRLRDRLAEADLIIYAPGTQHSSLFPSYLTSGMTEVIAGNLQAVKLLITNLQPDAEIEGSSAVDLLDRALYYLRDRDRRVLPTPALITHCLINAPETQTASYVQPGRLEGIEDPRLVRIGNFEAGTSGRHDAAKVLGPFVETLLRRRRRPRLVLLLHGTRSANKIVQTLLELRRGGIDNVPVDVTVCYLRDRPIDLGGLRALPFAVKWLEGPDPSLAFRDVVRASGADYAGLVDSSGMYNGEDVVGLVSQLPLGDPAAVWGSRRLSVQDIQESIRLRYRRNMVLGAVSYVGSHVLSVMYLLCYGHYVSDTLSDARLFSARYLADENIDVTHRQVNHHLLTALLGDKAELRELPVRFLPLSPDRARRTGIGDGLAAVATILRRRLRRRRRPDVNVPSHTASVETHAEGPSA